MDPATEKKYIRSVVRQVHPDLFSAWPYERAQNTEALQVGGCSSWGKHALLCMCAGIACGD